MKCERFSLVVQSGICYAVFDRGEGEVLNYLLLNKDVPVLRFSCIRNAFEEVECRELEWLTERKPLGYHNLTDFLSARQAPKHRKHIEELLKRYGCDDLEGFLNVTHALSLNDTYWVKPETSPLIWENISLYCNEFDELVSNAAFDGRFSAASLSSTSPEFGTDGQFAKCWVRENGQIMLYKSGSTTFEIEPLSEYLSCQIAERLHLPYVPYDLAFYHEKLISKCRLFTDEATGLVKAHDVIPRGERTVAAMLNYFSSIGSEDDFRRMCVLDALILNTDRHLGNFGVLVDNDTQRVLQMAPVYDNNRSLLFDMDDEQLKRTEWCIGTCSPRFGTDFVATARGMLTDAIRRDVRDLTDFSFMQHPRISASEERLQRLSAIVQEQVRRVLEG